jgi:hypothetical protein
MCGPEAEIDYAADAALNTIDSINANARKSDSGIK